MYDTHLLPSADTGDWSDGITTTEMLLAETPPFNDNVTGTIPEASMPSKIREENSTISSTYNKSKNIGSGQPIMHYCSLTGFIPFKFNVPTCIHM